jgi:hypothetical protein
MTGKHRRPANLRHAISLVWLALALHVSSALVAGLGIVGGESWLEWLVVDASAILVLIILTRGLHAESRTARWLLLPLPLLVTPFVFPRLLLAADQLTLWFTILQGTTQGLAVYFAFQGSKMADEA